MQYQYDVDLKSVGSYIKIARKSTGLNQEEFAEKIGIEEKYLSAIECGDACPSFPLMVAFSDKLNVSIQFLTRGTNDTSQNTAIPNETLYYIPETAGFTARQHKRLLKLIREMVRTFLDDSTK